MTKAKVVAMRISRKQALATMATESDIQEGIVKALELLGCTVLHTSAFRQKGPSGVSKGVPDLLFRHSAWPEFVFAGMEVKRPGGRASSEQRFYSEAGWYPIVFSIEDGVRAGLEMHRKVCVDLISMEELAAFEDRAERILNGLGVISA